MLTATLVLAAGCGGDRERSGSSRSTVPTTPTVSTPPTSTGAVRTSAGGSGGELRPNGVTAPRGSAESRPGGAGDEAGSPTYRVRIADAQVEPPVVGVPPYFRVVLRITSGDGQVHVVDIAGRSYRVAPRREEAVELPGLRPAQRLIGTVDGGRARLIVEASEGP